MPSISFIRIPDTREAKTVRAVNVTEEFFETLGIKPLRGSGFSRGTEKQAVVISHRFWRKELNGADDAIGSQIQMDKMFVPIPLHKQLAVTVPLHKVAGFG
jgi:hypothetical protein